MAASSSSDAVDLEKGPACDGPGRGKDSRLRTTAEEKGGLDGGEAHGNGHDRQDDDDDDDDEEEMPPSIVERVLSRVSSRSNGDLGPPPDGGRVAWAQCLAGHIVIMNTWGFINSFGVFQAYYVDLLHRSPDDVSWIGSLPTYLLFGLGTFTGRLVDAGHFRPVFAAGSVLLVAGALATSFCTRYWHLILAQGLAMGVANGCVFCPVITIISTWFERRRALALGIAACGSATGGLVFPAMARQLLPRLGFAWCVRAIALILLAGMVAANLLARPRVRPRKAGPLVDWGAFCDMEYTFYAAGSFCFFTAIYFAFFYAAAFSRDALSPPMTYAESLDLLLILNGVGSIGRVIPSYIADRVGAVNVLVPNTLAASAVVFGWIGVSSSGGMYPWACAYGIIAAGVQSLFPAGLSSLTKDYQKMGVRLGMTMTIVSFATLIGTPIAGAIIRSAGGGPDGVRRGYSGAQAFAGGMLALSCGCMCVVKGVRMRRTGEGWRGRV